MASIKYKNVYLNDYYTIVGPLEKESKLKKYDIALDDYYYKENTFEMAEIKMQNVVIDNILNKNKLKNSDIDLLVGGDLTNQISVTNYSAKCFNFPFLGLYSACATFPESLIVGANFLDNVNYKKVITVTSSHNLTAEKQFRYPIEYGAPKPHTATFTATGSVSTLLSKLSGNIKIESATIGTPIDMGISDANNLGAVMAPAAASTLCTHLDDLKRNPDYYDLILTGDLGCVGGDIFKEYLKRKSKIKLKNHLDAGCELFLSSQDTYAGGSGPVCLPLVLFDRIIPSEKYKKILIIGTGALHSSTLVNQKKSIPAIAHAVSLEVLG